MSQQEIKKKAEIDYIIKCLNGATPEQVHKMFIGATIICHGEDER